MKMSKNEFKALWNEAVEKAKFVKSVEVGGDAKFPFMILSEGILTIDSITWRVGSILLPAVGGFGAKNLLIPAIIGSFTGVSQLAIVVFILINLSQTKFGKPVKAELDDKGKEKKLYGTDAGIVEFVNKGLWDITVDYTIGRFAKNIFRNRVTHKMSSAQLDDLANQTVRVLDLGLLEKD